MNNGLSKSAMKKFVWSFAHTINFHWNTCAVYERMFFAYLCKAAIRGIFHFETLSNYEANLVPDVFNLLKRLSTSGKKRFLHSPTQRKLAPLFEEVFSLSNDPTNIAESPGAMSWVAVKNANTDAKERSANIAHAVFRCTCSLSAQAFNATCGQESKRTVSAAGCTLKKSHPRCKRLPSGFGQKYDRKLRFRGLGRVLSLLEIPTHSTTLSPLLGRPRKQQPIVHQWVKAGVF